MNKKRLTKSRLRQLVREEIQKILEGVEVDEIRNFESIASSVPSKDDIRVFREVLDGVLRDYIPGIDYSDGVYQNLKSYGVEGSNDEFFVYFSKDENGNYLIDVTVTNLMHTDKGTDVRVVTDENLSYRINTDDELENYTKDIRDILVDAFERLA